MIKKRIVQILVPVIIVAVIAGIWLMKNANKNETAGNLQTPLEITSVNIEEIKSKGLPIIIDFGSDSCIPCKEMYPVLVSMNEKMQGKAIIHFVDVWKNQNAAVDFPVQIIPTQVFITADGKPYVPSEELQNRIEFKRYSSKATNEHIFTTHEGGLTEDEMQSILLDMGVR